MSTSRQSLRFILSLRLYSSFITSRHGFDFLFLQFHRKVNFILMAKEGPVQSCYDTQADLDLHCKHRLKGIEFM